MGRPAEEREEERFMAKIVETFELYGKEYVLETGELAKQAGGAVVVRQGDTMVLVTATASKQPKDLDFFPLTVDFEERMYAAGKLPGGFIKRESRPSEKATLTARMIDRPHPLVVRRRVPQRGPGHRDGPLGRPGPPARRHLDHGRVGCADGRRHPVRGPAGRRAHLPRHRDRRVPRQPHLRRGRGLRPRPRGRRLQGRRLHARGRRAGGHRGGHARRPHVRPGGHRRLLRRAGALPRQGRDHSDGRPAPHRRPGARRPHLLRPVPTR